MEQPTFAQELRRMGPLVILVVSLHAALLAIPVRSARSDHVPGAHGQMQVRLLAGPPAQPAPATLPPADAGSMPAEEPAIERAPTEAAPVPPQPASTALPTRATEANVSPPAPAIGFVLPGGDRDADYFPRGMLSLVYGKAFRVAQQVRFIS